jgi:predicted DNA-binding protein with PD1-like motif
VSITGNISYFEEKVFIHAHGSFGRNDFSTLSGHVTDLTVGATLEIFLTDLDVTIERVYDEDSGLKLLNI